MRDIKDCFEAGDAEGIFEMLKDYAPGSLSQKREQGTLAKTVETTHGEVNIYHVNEGVFYFENKERSRSVKVNVAEESDLGKLTDFLNYRVELSSSDLQALKIRDWDRLNEVHKGLRPNNREFEPEDVFFGPGPRPGYYY